MLAALCAQRAAWLGFNRCQLSDVRVVTVWMSYDGTYLTNAQFRTVLATRTGHPTSCPYRRALGRRPLAARVFRFTVDACPIAAVHPVEYRVVHQGAPRKLGLDLS